MAYASLNTQDIRKDKPPEGLQIEVLTAPTYEPFTKAEIKNFLKVEHAADDDLIDSIIAGVRQLVEEKTRRAVCVQTLRTEWEKVYYMAKVPRPDHQSIDKVWRVDEEGDTELLTEGDDYHVRGLTRKEIYIPTRYTTGTTAGRTFDGLRVEFEAGYSPDKDSPTNDELRAAIPAALKLQMRRDIATIYEHRENFVVGTVVGRLPEPSVYSKWRVRI